MERAGMSAVDYIGVLGIYISRTHKPEPYTILFL